ncbi:helix-turn-helix domain-containing protein, partial [Crenobacter oryzisoli]
MPSHYHQLCPEERACIMQMTAQGHSLRHIARLLRRAPSSICREVRRNACSPHRYDAAAAGRKARQRSRLPRRPRKLQPHSAAFLVVVELLRQGWSPQQIQGRLRAHYPDDP